MARNWHEEHKDALTVGQRAADRMRNIMGSWSFVAVFITLMGLWAVANNLLGDRAWDRYPYILLNLFLSMLAGLQGAILLIAAKRMDAISGAMAQHDYETDLAAKAEIEALAKLNAEQLSILQDIRKRLGVDEC